MACPLPNTRGLLVSLASEYCPACSMGKRARQTFCFDCYRRLSPAVKRALYDRVGEGYEEAVSSAVASLGIVRFCLPPGGVA